jgi:capsular exopolysaccharide synthesis family protein
MIEPENRNTITFDNQVFYGFRGEYFNTQIRILQSRNLGKKVREEFRSTSRDKDMVIRGPFVEPVEATHLVEVGYRSTHPGAAAELVNLLFDKFIEFKLDLKSQSSQKAFKFISLQIDNLKDRLGRTEKEMNEYGNRKELFYLSREDSTVVRKFSDLNQAYTEAQIERINKESLYRELEGMSYENYPQVSKSQLIDGLKSTYSGFESEYKRKSQIFKPSYPEMLRLKSQMETLLERIQTETGDIAQKTLQTAKSEYQSAKKKENSLLELLSRQKGVMLSNKGDAIHYNSLSIEVQNMQTLLNYLVRKQKESVVSSRLEGIQTSNIKIIDPAEVPKTPVNAGKQKTLILAALLGLALGLGVIFLLDYLDQTIKTPEEVQALLGLPALGIIPSTTAKAVKAYGPYHYGYTSGNPGNKKKNPSPPRDIELINFSKPGSEEPDSWFVEKYRAVRTSIMLSTPGESPRIISVSSALPSEGKTATTLNLAVSFSQLGKKVLVIDGDLRRPRLHKIFKIKNDRGLSSYLAGRADSLVVLKTHIPKLFVVPPGPPPPHPAELIDSEMMAAFLQKLLEKMDFIFIDTPPLLAFKDAVVLGKHAQGTILVTWAAKTHRTALEKAKQELDRFNIRTLGVVLNRADEKRHIYGYNYKYYNYNYKYKKKKPGSESEPESLKDNEKRV